MKFRKIAATFIAMLTVCGAAVIPADIMPSVQTEIFAQAATNILEINAASGNGSSNIQNAINSLAKYGGTIKLTGNFTLDNIERIRGIGADYVSCGALTHSAPILDLSQKKKKKTGD